MKQHWIVVRQDGKWNQPRAFFQHETAEAALGEAERLAAKHPGVSFTIYGASMWIVGAVQIEATYLVES